MQDREEFTDSRARALKEFGVKDDSGVIFLHRYIVTHLSAPEILDRP